MGRYDYFTADQDGRKEFEAERRHFALDQISRLGSVISSFAGVPN